ncbi:MAG: DUF4349 domain-containing protein [Patescibacteria group bacterium]|nr:DUF4349 domain-containing protein [Patescibacteria group bacterium]
MPIKKYLKIAGMVLLAFIILYIGLIIAMGGIGQYTGDQASRQSGSASMSIALAPSTKSAPSFAGEIARDSVATMEAELGPSSAIQPVDKKIIKTGDLSLKVENAETAAESIANIAKLNKGEVAVSNFYESTKGVKSGAITVRVPYNNFDAAFNGIKKVASQVVSETANTQDITAEYIDLEARLKNTQAEEASFNALLNRSGKIEEILAVTKEIARTRGEIEQLQGQIRYLNSQTDMSTITVNITEDVEIATASQDWRPWQVVKLSVKQLITGGQNFVNGLIAFIIVVLPMLIIYGLIVWLIYYIGKKVYRKFI